MIGRMDIRFGLPDYYGSLHCGEGLKVLFDGEWIPARIEIGEFWYCRKVNFTDKINITIQQKASNCR